MWSVAGRGARLGRSPMRIYARIALGALVTLFGLLGSGPRVRVTTIRHHVLPDYCIFFRVGNGTRLLSFILCGLVALSLANQFQSKTEGHKTEERTPTEGEVYKENLIQRYTPTRAKKKSSNCIVMPIWKDASYFDSSSKDVGNGEPKYVTDDQKEVKDGQDNENDEKDKSEDYSSPKEVNTVGQHVNTVSHEVNTGRFKLNNADPSVNTTSLYDPDSPKESCSKLGLVHTIETTHVEFFSDEDAPQGTIEEEVYVTQPPGFKDPDNPDKVYKVVKALYGLHQAPKAWYETLANYLLGNGFKRGKIDQTLFIKKQKGDILLVHVYVDDIIFGSTNKELLQQKEDGIFISQDKYVDEILKKFNYTDVKSASTPVDLEKPLVKDGDANDVDVHLYRSMIGSLMYLTTSRPDIIYLKGKPTLGLWYSRDSPFELVAYTDSDYARATQDRKSTTRGCQFLGNRLISWQCKKQTMVATSTTEAEYVAAASCCGQGKGSTVPVESHHISITTPSTSQPPLSSTSKVPTPPYNSPLPRGHTPVSDEDSMTLNDLTVLFTQLSIKVANLEQDLKQTNKVYSNAYTKLIMRVKKLEHKVKSRQPIRRAKVVISDNEGTSWIQEYAEIQGRTSADTEILLDQEEPTELVGDLGSGEKGKKEISTANISVSTASATPEVSTAAENLVMQEQINKEERQRIARDAEIAKQLQEEFDRARQEQEVVAEADQAHDIDWSDPVVLRYHALQNRSFSVAEVRKNMCMYLKNHGGYKQSHFTETDIDVVPRDDIAIDVESLATKYPIVDWKAHVLIENMMYYQIIKADRSSKNYKVFSEMLDDFDRQDVMDLYRLVQERYDTTSPG
ncbi:putative ribonuclease H-like domain-containing protein [Tanacetum coccineum]